MNVIVTADGSKTLASSVFGETYGSRHGALSEALHVFLRGSGVESRLADKRPTRVLEVGFGTGLNFLVSAAAAAEHGAELHYTALEREAVDAATLREVYEGSSLPARLVAELIDWVDDLGASVADGVHRLTLGARKAVVLQLVIGDAPAAVAGGAVFRADTAKRAYDAIYLDAFSPKANPALWKPAFLARLAAGLAPGGTLVTFSVSGAVRRALAAAGLTVGKVPGPPGGKPEMLVASRSPLEP